MYKKHVVNLGAATLLVILMSTMVLGGFLLSAAAIMISPESRHTASIEQPVLPTGQVGQLSNQITSRAIDPTSKEANDLYGPLNRNATVEEKNGPILNLIRSRRFQSQGSYVCRTRSVVRVRPQSLQYYQPGYPSVQPQSPYLGLPIAVPGRCIPCQPQRPSPMPIPQGQPHPSDVTPGGPSFPSLPDTPRMQQDCPNCPPVVSPQDCPNCRPDLSRFGTVVKPSAPLLPMLPDLN